MRGNKYRIYQYRYKTPENFSNMLMNSDGEKPNFTPPYQIKNLTPFRQEVIDMNEYFIPRNGTAL